MTWLLLERWEPASNAGETVVVSVITVTVTAAVFRQQRLYRLPILLDPAIAFVPMVAGILAGGIAAAVTLALLHSRLVGLAWLAQPTAWCLASGATLLATRLTVAWRLQAYARAGRLTRRVALVGATTHGRAFLQRMVQDPWMATVGVYDDGGHHDGAAAMLPVRGTIDDLATHARLHPVDAVVIALPMADAERVADMQRRLASLAADIYLTSDVAGSAYPASSFTAFGGSSVVILAQRPLRDWRGLRKMAFDRAVGSLLVLLGLPLMGTIALAIKLTSPGPVLFRQPREGLHGAPFTILKFRTMAHGLAFDQGVQACRHDPRVTPLGQWLRRLSLDELPQLFNVLRGDMSLVGPRPHYAATRAGTRLFRDIVPGYAARHRVRPGLTGWAQVQGFRGETRTEQQLADRVEQDLYYIENWSIRFDLRILWRTLVQEIFSRSGNAY